jgi:divalent metal cation (Fe/Co/Zn/Cd) transporter
MTTIAISRNPLAKRILLLQVATLCWMLVECSVALASAWKARSVSLLAFGSDSLIELISAAVVLLQFTAWFRLSPPRAARFCGALLYALAGFISLVAFVGLLRRIEADTSLLGMVITAAALLLMPVLTWLKRDTAERTGDKALRADAVQSATCAYLAAVTLAGLLLRWAFGLHWLDPIAALIAVPILVLEARRARKGQTCACC